MKKLSHDDLSLINEAIAFYSFHNKIEIEKAQNLSRLLVQAVLDQGRLDDAHKRIRVMAETIEYLEG